MKAFENIISRLFEAPAKGLSVRSVLADPDIQRARAGRQCAPVSAV